MGDQSSQFWWNWGIQLLGVVATFLAIVVALFGDALRARFFPPVLRLALTDDSGEKTTRRTVFESYGKQKHLDEDARYFHVVVTNEQRWTPVEQVNVVLLGVERRDAGGIFRMVWSGDVPLVWRHQQAPAPRTIGPPGHADLFSLVKGSGLHLHPVIVPLNLPVQTNDAVHLILHLQARSTAVDSNFLAVDIEWDGQWADSRAELSDHLKINAVATTA